MEKHKDFSRYRRDRMQCEYKALYQGKLQEEILQSSAIARANGQKVDEDQMKQNLKSCRARQAQLMDQSHQLARSHPEFEYNSPIPEDQRYRLLPITSLSAKDAQNSASDTTSSDSSSHISRNTTHAAGKSASKKGKQPIVIIDDDEYDEVTDPLNHGKRSDAGTARSSNDTNTASKSTQIESQKSRARQYELLTNEDSKPATKRQKILNNSDDDDSHSTGARRTAKMSSHAGEVDRVQRKPQLHSELSGDKGPVGSSSITTLVEKPIQIPVDRGSVLKAVRKPRAALPTIIAGPSSANSTGAGTTEVESPTEVGAEPRSSASAAARMLPLWLSNLKFTKLRNGNLETRLYRFVEMISECSVATLNEDSAKLNELFDFMRADLHGIMFFKVPNKDTMYPIALKRTKFLSENQGLPMIFDPAIAKVSFPFDIQADAREVYNKLIAREFETDLFRGIILGGKNPVRHANVRSGDQINCTYPHRVHANYHGNGNLLNGQWWPTQICTVRDGAHGSSQGGIYGVKGSGAFSIVMSGGANYQDKDEGDEIWYSGTDGKDGKVTENTQRLVESCLGVTSRDAQGNDVAKKHPVRVIRSHNMQAAKSAFRPTKGLRYDGLYEAVDYRVVDATKQIYLFHLKRMPNQWPIRTDRPTDDELRAYGEDMRNHRGDGDAGVNSGIRARH